MWLLGVKSLGMKKPYLVTTRNTPLRYTPLGYILES